MSGEGEAERDTKELTVDEAPLRMLCSSSGVYGELVPEDALETDASSSVPSAAAGFSVVVLVFGEEDPFPVPEEVNWDRTVSSRPCGCDRGDGARRSGTRRG
jgi:hypothetical protein